MKPKAIQRGITPLHPSNADLGRGTQRTGSDQVLFANPELRRMRSRRGRSPAQKQAVMMWSAGLILVTLGILVAAVMLWLKPHLFHQPGLRAEDGELADRQVRVVSRFPSPSSEHALNLVRRALAIRDPSEVEELFRTGKASRAEIMQFCKASESRDGLVENYQWLSSLDVNGLLLDGVLVTFKGHEHPVERLALLTPDPTGKWQLDFEAFARTARPSWSELLEGNAPKAVVRVIVTRDPYYNGVFGDDKIWSCYRLFSNDREELMRGYCKIGSAEATAMDGMLPQDRPSVRATVEISRVDGAEPLQFQITRVITEDWVVAEAAASAE
jgi:hypothetical protein